jgi:hypothetical protein
MRLFAMPLSDGCVGCMMGGPLHKVDDLCVVPFTRSLSAEGSALLVRILIAITPRMYGEVLALTIHRRRPDFEVLLAPPGSLEGEIERFGPHVLVQDAEEAEPASQALPDGVLHCIRILNANRADATIEVDGTASELHDGLFEDLFEALEKAEGLSNGDGARAEDRRPEYHKGKATRRKDGGE